MSEPAPDLPTISPTRRRKAVGAFTAALLCGGIAALSAGEAGATPYGVAVLQGLDKVTARVSTIEAPVGTTVRFGTLEVIVRRCDKRPPEETPESAAFLDIWEARQGEAAISLFRGWMFASSPALNALEHPVYDIWVLDCAGDVLTGDAPVPRQDGDTKLPDLEKLLKPSN
jgi:hypothetical protein